MAVKKDDEVREESEYVKVETKSSRRRDSQRAQSNKS